MADPVQVDDATLIRWCAKVRRLPDDYYANTYRPMTSLNDAADVALETRLSWHVARDRVKVLRAGDPDDEPVIVHCPATTGSLAHALVLACYMVMEGGSR